MGFLDYGGLTSFWEKVKTVLTEKQDIIHFDNSLHVNGDTISVTTPVKGITQAEYDALSETEKNSGLYVITDANINLNDRGDIYSTEETRIGTWIDGKPLYRKCYSFTRTMGGGDEYTFATMSGLNAQRVTSFLVYFSRLTDGNKNSNYGTYGYKRNDELIVYNSITTGTYSFDTVITLEYTKTTDQTPTVSSVSTQSLSVNSLSSDSQSSEKVLTSQVPLPSYVAFAPASASASSAHFTFSPASASTINFTFAPASASSTNLTLRGE